MVLIFLESPLMNSSTIDTDVSCAEDGDLEVCCCYPPHQLLVSFYCTTKRVTKAGHMVHALKLSGRRFSGWLRGWG